MVKINVHMVPGNLTALPRLFEGTQGQVDAELMKRIFSILPAKSQYVRLLLSHITGRKLRPNDDAFQRLCQQIHIPRFREEWYTEYRVHALHVQPLYRLAENWIGLRHANLMFETGAVTGFFELRRDGSLPSQLRFPVLERIGLLSDQLIITASVNLEEAALYAWSLLESAAWHSKFSPDETSLRDFGDCLRADLANKDFTELLELLAPCDWHECEIEKPAKNIVNPDLSSKPVVRQSPETLVTGIKSEVVSESVHPIEAEIETKLQRLRLGSIEHHVKLTSLEAKAAQLHEVSSPDLIFNDFDVLIAECRQSFNELEREANDCVRFVNRNIANVIEQLGIDIEVVALNAPSIFNREFDGWAEPVRERVSLAKPLLQMGKALLKMDKEVLSAVLVHLPKRVVTLEEASSIFAELTRDVNKFASGLTAHRAFQAHLAIQFADFAWNPFYDPQLKTAQWMSLGEWLLSQSQLGPLLAICIRKEYGALSDGFALWLAKRSLSLNDTELAAILGLLRRLTLGQIEGLLRDSPHSMAVLAVSELDAYFGDADMPSTDTFVCWSARPLVDFTNQPGTDVFGQFLRTLFLLCSGGPGPGFAANEFRQALISARSDRSTKDKSQHAASAHDRLDSILRIHPGGGRTYAQLWACADETILEPLRATLQSSELAEVRSQYLQMRAAFDIEDYLHVWKAAIPERFRKRSEYDKKIRLAVNTKLHELDRWAADIQLLTNGPPGTQHDVRISDLMESIRSVSVADDPRCRILKLWFDLVAEGRVGPRVVALCMSRSKNPEFEAVTEIASVDAFHPRAFLRKIANRPVDYGCVLADELVRAFGHNNSSELARLFADQHLYEAYAALAVDSADESSPDLDRRVEAAVEELEQRQQQRIASLEARAQRLSGKDGEEFRAYLTEMRGHLVTQRWTMLEQELGELERLIEELERRSAIEFSCMYLRQQISALGGTAPPEADVGTLERLHEALFRSTAKQRKHIEPLMALASLDGLDPRLLASVNETIRVLQASQSLPSGVHSEYLAYALGDAFTPLGEQLRRSYNFVAAYRERLNALALTMLTALREAKNVAEAGAPLVAVLEETSKAWQSLSDTGEEIIDQILDVFRRHELKVALMELTPEQADASVDIDRHLPRGGVHESPMPESLDIEAAVAQFVQRMRVRDGSTKSSQKATDNLLNAAIERGRWKEAAELAHIIFTSSPNQTKQPSVEQLANWALCLLRSNDSTLTDDDYAVVLQLVNRAPTATAVKASMLTKHSKGAMGDIVATFIGRLARSVDADLCDKTVTEQVLVLAGRPDVIGHCRSLVNLAFTPKAGADSLTAHSLWDHFPVDAQKERAEARAAFMYLLWICSAPTALACCLRYPPIEMERRRADALAAVARQALATARFDPLQAFLDVRKTISAKPFQLFVDMLQRWAPIHTESAAALELMGQLEWTPDRTKLRGVLRILPRKTDCPDKIALTLPQGSPIRFAAGSLRTSIEGPFIEETTTSLEFQLVDSNASHFAVELQCDVDSITGARSQYSCFLDFDISGSLAFQPLRPDELEEAFGGFPEYQMRGQEYVPRHDDERKIEKALFGSKTVRSLWISSPRRSGKTTMLYRILDAYSHKCGRDNVVVYLTLDKSFSDSAEFNDWLWKRLVASLPNAELRHLYSNFSDLGRDLPRSADIGTFVGTLTDRLMNSEALVNPKRPVNRVIFLIDEVDKLASMYFEGGKAKEAAIDVIWQIRGVIGERRDVGFVFAGSSAAKRIFVTNADAPFFNSITLHELTPFSCKTAALEESARAIVEPQGIKGRYAMPRQSLDHLLWVCAGIPYYMKLLAGATYAVAKQSHILISTINEGLKALLTKASGLPKLDDMSGDPGSDELRTIAQKGEDRLLAQAVLYSVAEMHSPVSGHPIRRARISAPDSPLELRYGMPKRLIERGVDLCLDLGLLKLSSDDIPEVDFSTPILGESIRRAGGRLWANIDHELEELSAKQKVGDE